MAAAAHGTANSGIDFGEKSLTLNDPEMNEHTVLYGLQNERDILRYNNRVCRFFISYGLYIDTRAAV